ncbi:FAD-binding protein [Trujillonella endophytica]|uniref:FAD binding domain-containing protein n=1 Tax=Trujillonella endophytica TaxID=673521 RepID=A0A1H8W748_9ACTN|nr:FAD-binding protein [Trujillella endophytica]SEP23472.1 FAD binding domain-containing protein [Trujillella endophytica]
MPGAGNYDVVVVGFGVAGASAALEAARTGARVLVLDRRGVLIRPGALAGGTGADGAPAGASMRVRRRLRSRPRTAVPPLSTLRAEALAAGVEVCRQAAVHELVVEGGRVTGVGYAAMDMMTPSGARYWWLDRLSGWTPRLSAGLTRTLRRAAEALWHDASEVGAVSAGAVVLATDRAGWDFVGPAVWGAGVATARPAAGAARRRRLSLVADGATAPGPELEARAWCARETGLGAGTDALAELRVDRGTGQVCAGEGREVPGLFAAVPAPGDRTDALPADSALLVAVGRRAGRAAATGRPRRGHLRSVG